MEKVVVCGYPDLDIVNACPKEYQICCASCTDRCDICCKDVDTCKYKIEKEVR